MTTLAQLKTSVDSWLARDDVAVSGSDFAQILLVAESQIATDVRLVIQETSASLVFTGREADLPADFLEVRNPFIDDTVRKFEYKTPQALREGANWSTGRVGSFYTLEGNPTVATDARVKMVISAPATVAAPLTVDVNYIARLPALVNDPDTNWLLTNHYDCYLYAVLRAAAEYVDDHVLEDRYQAKYDRVIDKIRTHENRKRYGAMPKQSYGTPRAVI